MGCLGKGLVQRAIPMLELLNTTGSLGSCQAFIHSLKVRACRKTDDEGDHLRLDQQPGIHELCRTNLARHATRLDGVTRESGCHELRTALCHEGAATHYLNDQPQRLKVA